MSTKSVKVGSTKYPYYVRKNGSLQARVYNEFTKKQISVYAMTEIDLKRKIRDKKMEIASDPFGSLRKQGTWSVEKYFNDWLYNHKFNTVRQSSFDKNEQMLKQFIIPKIGKKMMMNVEPVDLQDLLNDVASRRSYSTVKKVREVISQGFRFAYESGDIERNPMRLVKMPIEMNCGKETKQIQIYREEEIVRMRDAIVDCYSRAGFYRISPLFIFIMNTGLRIGEALALKHEDIDLEEKTVHVRRTLSRIKERDPKDVTKYQYKIIETIPKTRTSDRIIDLNRSALWALDEIARRNELEGLEKTEHVFAAESGKFFNQRSIEDMLKRVCRRAGLEYYGLHALRHTFASMCFEKGVPVETVSKLLGHSSPNITREVYIHILPHQKRDAVELLDDILLGDEQKSKTIIPFSTLRNMKDYENRRSNAK